ncbi:carboxymuconolactone decarboxylase [Dyadobacter sp. CY261]|uniref:carboxymuconolactone decarboxylase family protein n=1 Tax=Dyadobacter sp. CY261 TaxID=2907203 RepID=UPI001F2119C1|nr:carboxymuconolactone decarboxylase [Dyadobacter sp. CY261]MCF0073505.1 carboxymuconolactone decarboxylase [Dyadobacter sp. CY261]
MAHIALPDESLPGIVGLFNFRPETAGPLQLLAETLLRGESPLTSGERELIASYVSHLNDTHFCHSSHGSAAMAHFGYDLNLIDDIKNGFEVIEVSPKLRALLHIAGKVQKSGKAVTDEDIAAARAEGAGDKDIHDTILIAAAFSMFNRYVDGLGTWAPQENEAYREMGQRMAFTGYVRYSVQADAEEV